MAKDEGLIFLLALVGFALGGAPTEGIPSITPTITPTITEAPTLQEDQLARHEEIVTTQEYQAPEIPSRPLGADITGPTTEDVIFAQEMPPDTTPAIGYILAEERPTDIGQEIIPLRLAEIGSLVIQEPGEAGPPPQLITEAPELRTTEERIVLGRVFR